MATDVSALTESEMARLYEIYKQTLTITPLAKESAQLAEMLELVHGDYIFMMDIKKDEIAIIYKERFLINMSSDVVMFAIEEVGSEVVGVLANESGYHCAIMRAIMAGIEEALNNIRREPKSKMNRKFKEWLADPSFITQRAKRLTNPLI